ncbi:MAG: hypothetical protein ACTTK1_05530, partial [Candidatus Cryptobacteroides sp.]
RQRLPPKKKSSMCTAWQAEFDDVPHGGIFIDAKEPLEFYICLLQGRGGEALGGEVPSKTMLSAAPA